MAEEAAVNPNTMQKALSELERYGLVYSQRTAGRYITEDSDMIDKLKIDLAKKQVGDFFSKMQQLGFNLKQTVDFVNKKAEELSK